MKTSPAACTFLIVAAAWLVTAGLLTIAAIAACVAGRPDWTAQLDKGAGLFALLATATTAAAGVAHFIRDRREN